MRRDRDRTAERRGLRRGDVFGRIPNLKDRSLTLVAPDVGTRRWTRRWIRSEDEENRHMHVIARKRCACCVCPAAWSKGKHASPRGTRDMSGTCRNAKLLFRINKWRFLEYYGVAFVVTIVFVLVCFNFADPVPFLLTFVIAFFLLIGWLLPIGNVGSYVAATEQGLKQYVPLNCAANWDVTWEEIDDWSFVEVAVGGRYVIWEPRICLAVKGRVFDTNSFIVRRREAEKITQVLLEYCGAPTDIRNPVLPPTNFGIKQMWRYPKGWTYFEEIRFQE